MRKPTKTISAPRSSAPALVSSTDLNNVAGGFQTDDNSLRFQTDDNSLRFQTDETSLNIKRR